ncbi:MAG: SprT family zinc-dependent metalloprotease [Balneolales bacterium]
MSDRNQLALFTDPEIEFVKRKRQKTIRIRVDHDRITVSGPLTCREKSLRGFLDDHWDWVRQTLEKQQVRSRKLEQQREVYKGHVLLKGEWLPLQPCRTGGKKEGWNFNLTENAVRFTPPAGCRSLPEADALNAYLKWMAKPEILARFEQVAPNLPFHYNRVFIRSQKTKWGTCSGKGNLSFNWRLIKCPCWIWDYLFVHELCHTIHFNHSKSYWKLVDEYFPRRNEAEAWIRKNGDVVFHT